MMKTYKFPKQILLLLPLLPACLTYSCLKDGHDEDNGNKVEHIAAIEKAKAIYEDLSPDFSIIQVRSSESSPLRIAFEPIWNDAFVMNTVTVPQRLRPTSLCRTHFICF